MHRILTFNCHEPYIHHLARLGIPLDVIDGLAGRLHRTWDQRSRPVPDNVRLIDLPTALGAGPYQAIIGHNISDLIAVKELNAPRILVLHVNLAARLKEEQPGLSAQEIAATLQQYLGVVGGVAVGVSQSKLESWGLQGMVIEPPVDPDQYGGYRGELAVALRVASQVSVRRDRFAWDLHLSALDGLPWHWAGTDSKDSRAQPAESWQALKELYRSHRLFVHTAADKLEDGYNLALLEAMASGMPVVTTAHDNSPVSNGINGFVGSDAATLRAGVLRLLSDHELARRMGAEARRAVIERFPVDRFCQRWREALELADARAKKARPAPASKSKPKTKRSARQRKRR